MKGVAHMDQEQQKRLIMELRERVNDLLAAAQLLSPLVREKGDSRDVEHLLILNQALYRLIRTIRHIDLDREEELTLHLRYIDAAGLCRDLGREVEGLLPAAGVRFSWTSEEESLLTLADDALLEQALLNLIANAVEHAGPSGKVELRFARREGRVLFCVSDNGGGLTPSGPEADPYLKQPGGVGLGLSDARRIAEGHGGSLILENRPGNGVQAVLSIPIRRPDGSTTVQTPMPRSHLGGFSPVLVELSPVLPPTAFSPEDLD